MVTRLLRNWMDARHPHLWKDQPSITKLAQESSDKQNFEWKPGGVATCKLWWQRCQSETAVDLVPGIDAVARAANLTWSE
jgi:hypothetical protein